VRKSRALAAVAIAVTALLHAAPPATTYQQKLQTARHQQTKDLLAMGGWLSLVALQPLDQGDVTVGSAPDNHLHLEHGTAHAMAFHMQGNNVILTSVNPAVLINGKPAQTGQVVTPGDKIAWKNLTATIIKRAGNRIFLRVADPQAPNRKAFHGLSFYPADPKYRVVANWVPYSPPHTLRMPTVIGSVLVLPAPGYAEFTVNGATVRLEPYESETGGLSFLFRDATYTTTTYGAGRELEAERPSNDLTKPGAVTLDFNLATNPPCAYTEFATCPLTTKENRLTIPIPAGEKRYHD
jgi:uncharacterized protein (DUF1684 family)